jgi:hypothetical protein
MVLGAFAFRKAVSTSVLVLLRVVKLAVACATRAAAATGRVVPRAVAPATAACGLAASSHQHAKPPFITRVARVAHQILRHHHHYNLLILRQRTTQFDIVIHSPLLSRGNLGAQRLLGSLCLKTSQNNLFRKARASELDLKEEDKKNSHEIQHYAQRLKENSGHDEASREH